MKRVNGILPKKADLDAKVKGDALGVATDLESLVAILDAARKRYFADGSDDAKQRYFKAVDAVEEFYARHRQEGRMTVWTLEARVDHEPGNLLGIYKSSEAAKTAALAHLEETKEEVVKHEESEGLIEWETKYGQVLACEWEVSD